MSEVADFARREWEQFKNSKTVKALLTMEAMALAAFVDQVAAGKVEFSFDGLRGWAIGQAVIVVLFLLRHALAGIEVKAEDAARAAGIPVDPAAIKTIEGRAVTNAVTNSAAFLESKGHADAARALREIGAQVVAGQGGSS